MITRTTAIAVLASSLALAAGAAPQGQLVVPNLNPGLKTVPFIPASHNPARMASACDKKLVTRIDSATVITGADGKVGHVTGMASGVMADVAELAITSMSPDGRTANADFVACSSPTSTATAPVATSLPLSTQPNVKWIAVRAQSNAITLDTGK